MFLPGAWRTFSPTWVDNWTFIGTFGFFLMLFLLFLRFLPVHHHRRGEGTAAASRTRTSTTRERGIHEPRRDAPKPRYQQEPASAK